MPPPKLYPALDLGPLPVDLINAVLGTELEPGDVYLSERAHRHMAEDHAADYPYCFPALPALIAAPILIGQAPKRTMNFELFRRVVHPDGKVAMAAVGLVVDEIGRYRVRSCYLVVKEVVDNRRLAGRLKPPPSR
jgi:hypothetical protein